jgi:methylglutaconyl-CoA hydratase
MVLGSEGKSFSAGADLEWMKRMASYSYDENLRDASALALMLKTLNEIPQPTIARVQGAAFGGAVGLVSCCDMAVAASAASFSLSEVKIGLVPATISPYVIAAIGQRAARRYFVTAERFDAHRALQLGLVNEVVDAEQLDQEIDRLINTLLANGPEAVTGAKQLVFDVAGKPIDQQLIDATCETIAAIRVSEQGQEGLQAFLEKRKPQWIKN